MFALTQKTKIYFIGIGGIGMSGIAKILLQLGYAVSGSDLSLGPVTDELKKMGAQIFSEHARGQIQDARVVVFSSAIKTTNPEYREAQEKGIPLVQRGEILAELMRLKFGLAIAGSHGKTTTTSMIATLFHTAGKDPTHIVGGIVQNLGNHAHSGKSDLLIAEADESDGSFLYLNPIYAILTNIDNDHLDYYKTVEILQSAFVQFANKVPFFGGVILNADDDGCQKIRPQIKRAVIDYGIAKNAQDTKRAKYMASDLKSSPTGIEYTFFKQGHVLGKMKLQVLGQHNVLNSLAAAATGLELGIDFETVAKGLNQFQGVGRRLEILKSEKDFLVIDDYGHHPSEVKAVLSTIKQTYPQKKFVVVFEPHRYSRTQQLWDDFCTAFANCDELHLLPIYPASETALAGITSENLLKDIKLSQKKLMPTFDDLIPLLKMYHGQNVCILGLGAGLISKKLRAALSTYDK
jgi:UDP-N-acetylmuramate--alanine ligase